MEYAPVDKGVKRIVDKGKKAKFKDYALLRTRRDEFSRMKFDELYRRVDSYTIQAIKNKKFDDKQYATVLRWVLRGLPVHMAIRKVNTDLEIQKYHEKRRRTLRDHLKKC